MVVNNRIWVIGAAIVMAAILALGFFLGVAPRLEEISSNNEQREGVVAQNEIQSLALAKLKADFENIAEYNAELAELQKAIPSYNDLSTFVGELHDLEDKSGVVLTNFVSTDAEPFVLDLGLTQPEAAAPVEGEEGEAAETPAPPVEPELPEGTPVQTLLPEEFVVINISLTVTGKQAAILNFVNSLQNGDRRFLVTGLSIRTEPNSSDYAATIDGNVYVLIDPRNPTGEEPEAPVEEEPEPTPTPTSPIPTETPTP